MKRTIIAILFGGLLVNACGIVTPITSSKGNLENLQLRMSKEQVKNEMGSPDEIRGSVINEQGNTVTVWQYKLYNSGTAITNFFVGILLLTTTWWTTFPNQGDLYWLYFVEDNLAQWGQAGDWREDVIMRIKLDK